MAGVFWRDSGGNRDREVWLQSISCPIIHYSIHWERRERRNFASGSVSFLTHQPHTLHQQQPIIRAESKPLARALRMSSLNQTVRDPTHFKPAIWSPYLIFCDLLWTRVHQGGERRGVLRRFIFVLPAPQPLHPPPSLPSPLQDIN